MVTLLERAPHDEERSNGMKEWRSREHTGLRQVLAVGRITLQQHSAPRNVSGSPVWLVRPFQVHGQLKPASAAFGEVALVTFCSQLETQSQCLFGKRLHELRFFVPNTVEALGEELWPVFEDYASTFWPSGHRRHQLDALHFLKFLRARNRPVELREFNRIQFAVSGHRVVFKVIIARRPICIGVHFLWRHGSGYRDWIWHVGKTAISSIKR